MQNALSRPKRLAVRDQIEKLIETMGQLYFTGRLDEVINYFVSPLPVYMASGIHLQPNLAEVRRSLSRLRRSAIAGGAKRLRHEIVSLRTSGANSVALVHWRYYDAEGEVIASSEVNYYCGPNPEGRLCILMVEYLDHSFIGEDLSIEPIVQKSATVH